MSPIVEDKPSTDSVQEMAVAPLNGDGGEVDKQEKKEEGLLRNGLQSPLRTCAVLSTSFLFAYTANLAIQNLQSSLNQAEGLGVISLAVLYGSIIFFGSVSPFVIKLLRAKWVLVIAWVCHLLYTLSNFYPRFPTLLTSSLLLGMIAGPMWTAQGLYMSASGLVYSEDNQITLHAALSRLNGIFFACYESTQITGNLIASLVLMRGTYNESVLQSPGRICGADVCPGDSTNTTKIEQPETYIVNTLLGIFLACNAVALVLAVVAMPHLPRDKECQTEGAKESLASCLSMLLEPRMLLLLPFFMAQAMNSGILTAEYTQAFVSCSVGVQWVGYVMVAFGVLTAALAIGLNFSAKVVGRQILFPAAAVADMSWVLAMVLWIPLGDSVGTFFILPAVSGFAEGIFQAQFNSLVAMVFPDKIAAAFATYHTSKATAFTVTFVLAHFLCLRDRLYVALALSALGLGGYATLEVWIARDQRRQRSISRAEEKDAVKQPDSVADLVKNSTDF